MRCSKKFWLYWLLATGAMLSAQPPAPKPSPAWKQLDFLLGKWIGVADGNTPLGSGGGECSFDAELNNRIIVRHNKATYTSGVTHDDLLVIYAEPPDGPPRAIYFDTEGHTIRYNLKFPKAESVVFESDGSQPGPRYRLSYWTESSVLKGRFEIAPPGGDYKPYLTWSTKKI